jgi:hypothetical protein
LGLDLGLGLDLDFARAPAVDLPRVLMGWAVAADEDVLLDDELEPLRVTITKLL